MLRCLGILSCVPIVLAPGVADARRGGADARLRNCGTATCVVLAGVRADTTERVMVAGHPVAARGGRRFEVVVSVAAVRAWSAPFARTIALTTVRPGGDAVTRAVRLPIGLLGHVTELAALEVSAR